MNFRDIEEVYDKVYEDVSWDEVGRKTQLNLRKLKKYIKELQNERDLLLAEVGKLKNLNDDEIEEWLNAKKNNNKK